MTPDRDFALVRRARDGDRDAFTQLVRAHQDRVFTLVRGMVRNPDDAADITQETFIAVLRHLDQFQEGARFSTWLHRIAVRKAYDHLRRRVPDPVDPATAPVTMQAARSDDPQTQHLQQRDLLGAIAGLDDGFREALLLVDVLGVSVQEAAGVLGVAPGTVNSRVFRARSALAKVLEMWGTTGHQGASK
jgi:RNA polymerase sigma-70 factor (ECF subfamily)